MVCSSIAGLPFLSGKPVYFLLDHSQPIVAGPDKGNNYELRTCRSQGRHDPRIC